MWWQGKGSLICLVQLYELRMVIVNFLCLSLQVESVAIKYVSGIKQAVSLFMRLLSPLLGWGQWEERCYLFSF